MTKKIIIFIFFISSINCCGQSIPANTIADHYKTSKFDLAIFPATSLDMIPGKRFTPTRKEVEFAELALRNQLKELNMPLINQHESPIIHKKLRKFKRQYFGYLNENGHRILLINCFWKKRKLDNWLNSKVSVLDGGSYYWKINFDLNTFKLYDLYINGSG